MDKSYKINFHLLEACNYRCRHCFAHFDSHSVLPAQAWKQIIANCVRSIPVQGFNLAGGEPLLYPELPELIWFINALGYPCSIVTNGSRMDEYWIRTYARYFQTIGFSIDSFDQETLILQGRCDSRENFLSMERFLQLCHWIRTYHTDCRIKMNTVVTALNWQENLAPIIRTIPLSRWKILKMDVFRNDTFDNSDISVSSEEYQSFVRQNLEVFGISAAGSGKYRTASGMEIVLEETVDASYIMIDANGYLVDNSKDDSYIPVINCLTEDFGKGFEKLTFDEKLYFSRY